ncbi:unnamed protein product [Rotaria sordida]|nr:unnamed protein product [Rotaria sordida]
MDSSTYNKRGGSKAPISLELQTVLANHLQNIGFYGDGDKHIGVTSDFTLNIVEYVYDVINRYIKEDVQLHDTIDKLIVKPSTVVINSPDIINDQVNKLSVFMGEMEDDYEEEEKMEDECSS